MLRTVKKKKRVDLYEIFEMVHSGQLAEGSEITAEIDVEVTGQTYFDAIVYVYTSRYRNSDNVTVFNNECLDGIDKRNGVCAYALNGGRLELIWEAKRGR